MTVDPAFWARMLRAQAGLADVSPLDLEELLAWCPIRFCEIPIDGFLGMYLSVSERHGIMIKEGQHPAQRRFTMAHELGHFGIPAHNKLAKHHYQCLESDIGPIKVASAIEREANAFAAELLMPRGQFRRAMKNKDPSFHNIVYLASTLFDVSVTACALRWVELSSAPCALLCYENGRLNWNYRSRSFTYDLPPKGTKPPPDTLALEIVSGREGSNQLTSVQPNRWFSHRPDVSDVSETTFGAAGANWCLSLISIVEES